MKNDLVLGVAGICGALLVAGLLAWAGGQHGAVVAGQPLMLWCAVFAFGVQWIHTELCKASHCLTAKSSAVLGGEACP